MRNTKLLFAVLLVCALMIAALVSCTNGSASVTTQGNTAGNTTVDNGVTTAPVTTTAIITTTVTTKAVDIYQNPIASIEADTWSSYGTGDPFIMRFDGKYYLYPSTFDPMTGIKCWSSYDLVNWKYEGLCAKEGLTKGAYAPEVTYINGVFYMVTSPAGRGHYLLTSTSPTGPFTAVTGNWGQSIDGHIFVDNDGKVYFYRANSGDILAYEIQSAEGGSISFGPQINTGAVISDGANNWTEGPMVVYHDGYYYLTYTGNHIMNAAYRIDYASSSSSATKYTIAKENPLLVSTTLPVIGLGHSSSVKGPNLDSYYIVYHSLLGTLPNRDTRIDRLVFDGMLMYALGPTTGEVQAPEMPEIYAFFDDKADADKFDGVFSVSGGSMTLAAGATVISKDALNGDVYTIEVTTNNIKSGGNAGVIFGYKDENNYGSALFDTKNQKLVVTFVVNGTKTEKKVDLVKVFGKNYDFKAVHAIQVEKSGNTFTFYVDDRELCKFDSTLDGTKIGVKAEGADASFGYVGATANMGGSSAKDFYKPVGSENGFLLASHCVERNYEIFRTNKGESYLEVKEGDVFTYKVMAEVAGLYDIAPSINAKGALKVEIRVDGQLVGEVSYAKESYYRTRGVYDVSLTKGQHEIEVKIVSGEGEMNHVTVLKTVKLKEVNESYTTKDSSQKYKDGTGLAVKNDKMVVSSWGKRLYGDYDMNNYTLEVTVKPNSGATAGLLVRAKNPAESTLIGGVNRNMLIITTTDAGAREGANWLQGYYIEFKDGLAAIYDCNYDAERVAYKSFKLENNKTYVIKAVCDGANIKVYVDDKLVIDYTDATPWLHGMAGIRYAGGTTQYDDLKITKNN